MSHPSVVAVVMRRRLRAPAGVIIIPSGDPNLLGVGSADNSLVEFPKTGSVTTGDWFVDPNAGTNGTGTFASPFNNLGSAFAAASGGQTILVRGGTINLTSRINRSSGYTVGAPLKVFAYGTERVVLNGSALPSGNTSSQILRFYSGASYEHWKGFDFTGGLGIAVAILGHHITLEDCHFYDLTMNDTVGGSAIRFQDATCYDCVVQDSAFWRIGDPTNTSLGTNQPDCIQFTSTDGQTTKNHRLVRSFFRDGPDDCVDLFRSEYVQVIDCVAVNGGRFWTGARGGDGSNFKMGGSNYSTIGNAQLIGCLSIDGASESIKPNSAPEPVTALRSTQVGAENYGFNFSNEIIGDKHVVTDCIEHDSGNASSPGMDTRYVIATNNSWQVGITDPLFAAPGEGDYSLAAGSPAIGAASGGGNLGASVTALAIAKEWLAKNLT